MTTAPAKIIKLNASEDPIYFASNNKHYINEMIKLTGCVLFRGLKPLEAAVFSDFLNAISMTKMDYINRSTPRSSIDNASGIMTATEYPKSEEIPLHSESSYHCAWPSYISFNCIRPAETGGQTTVGDLQSITNMIPNYIFDPLVKYGVTYIRHFWPRLDLSLEDAFQNSSVEFVERYCAENNIEFHWENVGCFRTKQTRPASIYNSQLNMNIYFNQAHLFHNSRLDAEVRSTLASILGADRMPRHATYGNGDEIDSKHIFMLLDIMEKNSTHISWEVGDILLLDNLRYAHGRRSYTGVRKVLAALLNPSSETGLNAFRSRRPN